MQMAKRSIVVASVFGILSTCYVAINGDESAYVNGHTQPMKLAAYEGLWDGVDNAGLVLFGIPNGAKEPGDSEEPFHFEIQFPGALSFLTHREFGRFVPGINDLVYGNEEQGVEGVQEKMVKGKLAVTALAAYKAAQKEGNEAAAAGALAAFQQNEKYLGYGYLENAEDAVPSVNLLFYSFHTMVGIGMLLMLIFIAFIVSSLRGKVEENKPLLIVGVASFFLSMIASQSGWLVAEMGRQPWAIQDLLPVHVATTNIGAGSVMTTFFIFAAVFTLLLIAEIKIMLAQIKKGPEGV